MADSIRRLLHDQRTKGQGGNAGVKDESSSPDVSAAHMKAEALAHLAMGIVFLSAYREMLAKESKSGTGLRPLLNQLSLDVAKVAAALEGVEKMAGLVEDGSV